MRTVVRAARNVDPFKLRVSRGRRAKFRPAQLVRAVAMERADRGGRRRRTPAPRRRSLDSRHEQPRRVQQSRPPASARRRGDPRTSRATLLRDQRLGRAAAGRPRRAPARALSGFEGGRVFFTLGGADANEHAVKIVRQALGKPRGVVIARDRSYHGSTHLAMALSGDTRTRAMVDPDAMGRQSRRATVCVSLPVRQRGRRRMRRARGRRDRRSHRPLRYRGSRRRRYRRAECRLQWHRRAGQLLAGRAPSHRHARHSADRRRSHERLWPLRRMVRLATLRRRPANRTS